MIYLGLYAGCRVSKTAAMGPQHDKGDRLRFIGKGGKTREVPIHAGLRAELPLIFAQETRAPNVTRFARVMRQRTKIAFRPHALRATFAHVEEADIHHDVRASLLGTRLDSDHGVLRRLVATQGPGNRSTRLQPST